MEYPTQVLFVLNAEGDYSDTELLSHVSPNRYEYVLYRLSDFEPPPVVREDGKRLQVDWDGLVDATERMISAARDRAHGIERPVEFYAAGLAPLPLFTYFGMELSAWGPPLVLLNRRKTKQWDVLPLVGQDAGQHNQFFDVVQGLSGTGPAEGTGHVALFVSASGQPAPREAIRSALREDGKELTAIIEIRTNDSKYLDTATSAVAAEQLATLVSQIPGTYPYAAGLALFVFGPAPLAHLTGRAVNPTMFSEILIAHFEPPGYEIVLRRPRPGRRARPTPMGTKDELARAQVLEEMKAGIEEVQRTVQTQDLPDFLDSDGKKKFLDNLQRVQLPVTPEGESFELHVLQERMVLGHGLLEALRRDSPESIRRIAALLFLHEVYHFDQHLQTTNYRNIGRAGVALEELDFWADAVAVCALTLRDIRHAPSGGENVTGLCLLANAESILSGIEAFDRFEQGERIGRLTERRLRRYLIWNLQLARARTKPRTREHVQSMLADRLIAELAPLVGPVDGRYEKLVSRPHPITEFYVVLEKRLFRYPSNAYMDPGHMIECVRTFDRKGLVAPMDYVVGERHQDFGPWTTESM